MGNEVLAKRLVRIAEEIGQTSDDEWDLPNYIRHTDGQNRHTFIEEEQEGLRSPFRDSSRKDIKDTLRYIRKYTDEVEHAKTYEELLRAMKYLDLKVFNLKNDVKDWLELIKLPAKDINDVDF